MAISPLDGVTLAIVAIACLRGLFIGLIREGFSIAALGGALIATRYGTGPTAQWLHDSTAGQIGMAAGAWIAGVVIGIATVVSIVMVGRWLRKGARAAGLGWADRLGGGALGLAEGALVAAVVVLAATWAVGRDHPSIAAARSLSAYDQLQSFVVAAQRETQRAELPDVASPAH